MGALGQLRGVWRAVWHKGEARGGSYARDGMGMLGLVSAWALLAPWVSARGGQGFWGRALADPGLLDGPRGQESKGVGPKPLFHQLYFLAKVSSSSHAHLSPSQHQGQPQLEK